MVFLNIKSHDQAVQCCRTEDRVIVGGKYFICNYYLISFVIYI